ncbi:HAMP domain-containing histidine kinase [Tumebacillus sp. ITR2]|uniref:histidine kinase n=1 Tax=Tumebacillus amylolyticus TaxID=2801339 RepID=A0ABS1J5K7_9BACL|nr:HAMP domain-containing histidine kinase [Tumebacillus amylolyticus]
MFSSSKKQSLQTKIAWILTGLAFVVVVLAAWILDSIDHYHFMQYVDQNREMRNQRIANVLSQAYERDGGWKQHTGEDVARLSSLEGLHIHLLNSEHEKVWASDTPSQEGVHDTVTIQSAGLTVGYLEISYVDPDSYSQLDYHFRQAMTQGVFSTIVPVLMIALGVSWFLSRRISRPLVEMNKLAGQMRRGNWGLRIQKPGGGVELTQLAESLNHLSEELQKQDMLRRHLTSDVAHELRTPLTTLKGHLEALSDGVWEPSKQRYDTISSEVERLIGLVSSLEKLTAAESDSLDLRNQPIDLVELSKDTVELIQPSFDQKGVKLIMHPAESVTVMLDADKWKQILLNLLDNALKYTPPEGRVEVTIKMAKRKVVFEVSDKGVGISEEHLPYLFERFYRVDRSRNRSTGGAGIGLAIVNKYVEAHGGTIQVESKIGLGTTFRIELPTIEKSLPR